MESLHKTPIEICADWCDRYIAENFRPIDYESRWYSRTGVRAAQLLSAAQKAGLEFDLEQVTPHLKRSVFTVADDTFIPRDYAEIEHRIARKNAAFTLKKERLKKLLGEIFSALMAEPGPGWGDRLLDLRHEYQALESIDPEDLLEHHESMEKDQ